MRAIESGSALVIDSSGRVVAATAELLAASGRPLMDILGGSPSEIWPGLGDVAVAPSLERARNGSMDFVGLGLPNGEQLFVATIPRAREAREGPSDAPARAAWRAVDACLARATRGAGGGPASTVSAERVERLRSLVPFLLTAAREAASAEIWRWTASADARVLLDAAVEAAQPRLPQPTRIQRNYQPARLTNIDAAWLEEALADILLVAGTALAAAAQASAAFSPDLELATDADDGIRLLVSHNSPDQSPIVLRALLGESRIGPEGPSSRTLVRARRLVRALGGELDAHVKPTGGATFIVRFPAGGRG